MTTKSVSTVGSKLYLMDKSKSPPAVLAVDQLKGFSPIGGPRKKIDKSNTDSAGCDEYAGGRSAPAEASGELVLDLSNVNHQSLIKLFKWGASGGANISYYDGDSDSPAPPTIKNGALRPPVTGSPAGSWSRSGQYGDCYVSDFSIKKVDNDIVRADVKIQTSGFATSVLKGDLTTKSY
jgi:hypothetical protein